MNYNIAVVDDMRLDSEKLQREIYRWFDGRNKVMQANLTYYPNGESLLTNFEPEKFQIIFMDIIMNSLDGLETVRKLRMLDNRVLIIFTTSSRDFAFDAFPLHPFDYVIKPYDSKRLGQVLTEAVNFLEPPEPSVTVKVSRSNYSIRMRDISAVLSRDHMIEVVMTGGNCLLCTITFKEFSEVLKADARFLECNRGVIINMDCVQTLSRDKGAFVMKDGSHYPIRVREYKKIITAFTQYQIARNRSIRP